MFLCPLVGAKFIFGSMILGRPPHIEYRVLHTKNLTCLKQMSQNFHDHPLRKLHLAQNLTVNGTTLAKTKNIYYTQKHEHHDRIACLS